MRSPVRQPPGRATSGRVLPRFSRFKAAVSPARLVRLTVLPALFLAVWGGVGYLDLFPPFFLPSPLDVLVALRDLLLSGVLLQDLAASGYRIVAGLAVAAAVGIPLGLLIGWSSRMADLFELPFHLLRPIPPIAWVPFSLIWFRSGLASAAFVVFLGAFFPIVLNAAGGVRAVERRYLEAAWNMGCSDGQILGHVVLPASGPALVTGVRVGFGVGWMTVVAAEFMGQAHGLGARIIESYNLIRMDRMVAAMILVGLIGLAFDLTLRLLSNRLFPWADEAALPGGYGNRLGTAEASQPEASAPGYAGARRSSSTSSATVSKRLWVMRWMPGAAVSRTARMNSRARLRP